jgi:hypothetical protein
MVPVDSDSIHTSRFSLKYRAARMYMYRMSDSSISSGSDETVVTERFQYRNRDGGPDAEFL